MQWPLESKETYVLFDPIVRDIVERSENLETGWFTNGGEFERDRTTADGDSTVTSNELIVDPDITAALSPCGSSCATIAAAWAPHDSPSTLCSRRASARASTSGACAHSVACAPGVPAADQSAGRQRAPFDTLAHV